MTDTVTEAHGLTEAEKKTLAKLLEKVNIGNTHSPAVRIGREYVALVNLSVPRRDNTREDRQVDLVRAGDSVWLTDDEAAKFLRHGDRDGRRVAVIRLKSEVDNNNPPKPHPSLLTGPIMRPATPAPGSDGPRPDPAGATRVIEQTTIPESEVVPVAPQDAMDILPGQPISGGEIGGNAYVQAGADQDLMAAVKAQSGLTKGTRGK